MQFVYEDEQKNTLSFIGDILTVPKPKESKYKHEYQEICDELEKYIGKSAWILPYKPGFTEQKIRRAFEIARRKNIITLPYIIGIIKRDKGL